MCWGSLQDKGCIEAGEKGKMIHACECTAPKPSLLRFPPQSFLFTMAHPAPSSSWTQMHIPPQLLPLFHLLGNLNVLSEHPFTLWHNVACNGWPPLGLLDRLFTVSPLCMWCNIRVFSGSTEEGTGLQAIVLSPSPLLLFFFAWVTHQKSPYALFSPHPRSGQYERSPRERRTKGHTWHTKAFGIWVRIVNWS